MCLEITQLLTSGCLRSRQVMQRECIAEAVHGSCDPEGVWGLNSKACKLTDLATLVFEIVSPRKQFNGAVDGMRGTNALSSRASATHLILQRL